MSKSSSQPQYFISFSFFYSLVLICKYELSTTFQDLEIKNVINTILAPRGGNGRLPQDSCLGNPMDRGA